MDERMILSSGLKALELLRKVYDPLIRERLIEAVSATDTKIDDTIFKFVDKAIKGETALADNEIVGILIQLYCPYLRDPLKALIEGTGTKADDIVFKIIDMVFGCCDDDNC